MVGVDVNWFVRFLIWSGIRERKLTKEEIIENNWDVIKGLGKQSGTPKPQIFVYRDTTGNLLISQVKQSHELLGIIPILGLDESEKE